VLKREHVAFLFIFSLLGTLIGISVSFIPVFSWSNGGFSDDPSNPKYGTNDWIAQFYLKVLEHYVYVPFYYQVKNYYCGPAALQMVFDFYGENISQLEIADVARTVPHMTYAEELRRAAHFSNSSTSMGNEIPEYNITGYDQRNLGYAAFEQEGMTIDDLKSLIDMDYPVILLMKWAPEEPYGHYRVVVGYNQTYVFLHDPWNNIGWGGDYGGPDLAMNYSFFLNMWDYSSRWGLFVSPWKIVTDMPKIVYVGEHLRITANITYVCPSPFNIYEYPASSCNATITLPHGLTLADGENATKNLGNLQAGSTIQASWVAEAKFSGNYSFTVEAEGKIDGFVGEKPEIGSNYYQDKIGGCVLNLAIIAEDVNPPDIGIPNQRPPHNEVMPYQNVSVSINITDMESGVRNATLHYSINNDTTWITILMKYNSTSRLYWATIPGYSEGTLIKYATVAYDNAGNNATRDGAEQYCAYKVISEFPSALIVPLFLSFTALAVGFKKRRIRQKLEISDL